MKPFFFYFQVFELFKNKKYFNSISILEATGQYLPYILTGWTFVGVTALYYVIRKTA